jgi:hypothetical protein
MQVERLKYLDGVQYRLKGRSIIQVEGWMEYNAGGKAKVLYRWKAGWSTMQVERLKYYTGGRLENNVGGNAEVLSGWKAVWSNADGKG